jgi:LPXTG-motif cell wall-anchored protein
VWDKVGSFFSVKRLGLLLVVFGVMLFAAPAIAQDFEDCVIIDDELVCFDDDDDDDNNDFVGGTGSQEFSQEDVESGDVEPSVGISNTGNNANICAAIAQAANSGNVQNQQGVSQYLAYADDIEFEGSSIEISSDLAQECVQTIRQSAAAGAAPAARAGAAAGPGAAAAAGPAAAAPAAAGPAAAAPAVLAAAGAPPGGAAAKAGGGMLPKTGGPGEIAPLVAAAGLLLVGGGLLAYRRFFMQQ